MNYQKVYDKLWMDAVCRMMDKMDLDVLDWMDDDDKATFLKAQLKLGYIEQEDYDLMMGN